MAKQRLVRGLGINDSTTTIATRDPNTGKITWRCPYYWQWSNLLSRVSGTYSDVTPAYDGVTICKEWLLLSTFLTWMKEQEWEGKALDKDILTNGNKHYSPDNCRFVEQRTNNTLADVGRKRLTNHHLPKGITAYPHAGMNYKAAVGKQGVSGYAKATFVELQDAVDFYNENRALLILECLKWENDPLVRQGINREAGKLWTFA